MNFPRSPTRANATLALLLERSFVSCLVKLTVTLGGQPTENEAAAPGAALLAAAAGEPARSAADCMLAIAAGSLVRVPARAPREGVESAERGASDDEPRPP